MIKNNIRTSISTLNRNLRFLTFFMFLLFSLFFLIKKEIAMAKFRTFMEPSSSESLKILILFHFFHLMSSDL